ncbi:RHS repeat-associated core domain-containing protein [Citrobacter freundii]|nr:RHS repeat-associated core domain-containing protein [Citrobacter freundii]
MRDMTMGYTGQRRSGVSGHYLLGNGYRGFNPVLKRFAGQDSMSPFGAGGEHGFAYCGGNPVNRADSSGHLFDLFLLLFMVTDIAADATVDAAIDSAVVAGRRVIGKNSAGLEEEFFDQSLYRVDSRSLEAVRTSGFASTSDYDAIKKMTDAEESLTVATSLKGARRYLEGSRNYSGAKMHIYKIPAGSNIDGVSLNHNIKYNLRDVLHFLEDDTSVDEYLQDPTDLTALVNGANSLHEAHVSLEAVNRVRGNITQVDENILPPLESGIGKNKGNGGWRDYF